MGRRGGIEELLYLLEDAFSGHGAKPTDESAALLPNLGSVDEAAWRALPPGAARTIEDIARHVGACKVMYDDYAFGPGTMRFDTPEVEPWGNDPAPKAEVVAWLEVAHRRLVDHFAALKRDEELDRMRMTNWGELRSTRWIATVLITHDTYHAGEINHQRSILGPDDRWRYEQPGT